MEGIEYDWVNECQSVIADAAKTNKYSGTAIEKILKKLVPIMLQGATYEERQLFYKMIKETPIIVFPETLKCTHKDIVESIFSKVDTNVEVLEHEGDSYDKLAGAAAFISRPCFSKDGSVLGAIKFIYIKSEDEVERLLAESESLTDENDILRSNRLRIYKTPINITQFAHELGHAWASEDEPYTRSGDILIERVGAGRIYYKIGQSSSGKFTMQEIGKEGLLTEEMLNTEMELDAVAKFLGISREFLQSLYDRGYLLPSIYQGEMLQISELLRNTKLGKYIRDWRLRGCPKATDKLNQLMGTSPIYINRATDREDEIGVEQIFREPDKYEVGEFCEQNKNDFSVDKSSLTPLQLFNCAIKQVFDISSYKMLGNKIPDDTYNILMKPAITTARGLIEDAIRAMEIEKKQDKEAPKITD